MRLRKVLQWLGWCPKETLRRPVSFTPTDVVRPYVVAYAAMRGLTLLGSFLLGAFFTSVLYSRTVQTVFPRPPGAMQGDLLTLSFVAFILLGTVLIMYSRRQTLRVAPGEEAVILRSGRFYAWVRPGTYHLTPLTDRAVMRNLQDAYRVTRYGDFSTRDYYGLSIEATAQFLMGVMVGLYGN
jgi:hypothetical protein